VILYYCVSNDEFSGEEGSDGEEFPALVLASEVCCCVFDEEEENGGKVLDKVSKTVSITAAYWSTCRCISVICSKYIAL
jgi:hypothetical protein